jgi:anti-anti-sigma factor
MPVPPEHDDAVLRVHAGPGVLVLSGELDLLGRVPLEHAIAEHDAAAPLVIDLEDVAFLDSSGLRSLLWARQRAEEAGGGVTLRRPTTPVLRVLEVSGTLSLFTIEGSR